MAKSPFNFDPDSAKKAQARAAKNKPSLHPADLQPEVEVKNISGDPSAMPRDLMPRRSAPPPSDPMHARFVDARPAPRERMISGRFGRKLDDVAPGTRPTPGSFEHYAATTCHRHPRDQRPDPQAADWSARPSAVKHLGYGGSGYPEPHRADVSFGDGDHYGGVVDGRFARGTTPWAAHDPEMVNGRHDAHGLPTTPEGAIDRYGKFQGNFTIGVESNG